MSEWREVADALPEVAASGDSAAVAPAPAAAAASASATPQAHGWVEKSAYNYDVYTKSSKEVDEAKADYEANGVEVGEWAGNAAVYKWDDDFGDVGPRFPELEKQLFGGEVMKQGIDFQK